VCDEPERQLAAQDRLELQTLILRRAGRRPAGIGDEDVRLFLQAAHVRAAAQQAAGLV
jgi:hypothetical protein